MAELLEAARLQGVPIVELRRGVLAQVADAVTPQGCAAIGRRRHARLDHLGDGPIIVLDQIADPGNLGAVARVAEACACAGVVVTSGSTDPFGPKALRGSTGSIFRVPVVEATSLGDVAARLKSLGRAVIGTSSHQGVDFAQVEWPRSLALVFGNEAAGLDAEALASMTDVVTVPLAPTVESLNLAVSAGILCMAASRGLRATSPDALASTMHAMRAGEPT